MDLLFNDRIQLMQGDCLERMKEIPDQSIDLILTDPPYGTTACKWDSVIPFAPMWQQLKRIIKKDGVIALFGSEPFSSFLRCSEIELFKYDWIWRKTIPSSFVHAKNMPMRITENISVFSLGKMGHSSLLKEKRMRYFPQGLEIINKYKKRNRTYDFSRTNGNRPSHKEIVFQEFTNYPRNLIEFPSAAKGSKKIIHPTQKPVPLLEYLIRTYTQEDEVILDFTFGSCSTGIAAVNTNRRFIGIELDETYYQLGLSRIQQHLQTFHQTSLSAAAGIPL